MRIRRLMFAALIAAAPALPVNANPFGDSSARSDMAEENEVIRVLGQTLVRGNGANGVPAGVNIFYTVGHVNSCAPRIRLWTGREGTSAAAPIGNADALPVTNISNLVLQGPSQLKIEFNDGSNIVLALNSEAHRSELIDALHAFGSACRNRNG